MRTTAVLSAPVPAATRIIKFKPHKWHVIPDAIHSNRFNLEIATGNVLCTLDFPEDVTATHIEFLNLIASAPELRDIAEMYRDSMTGKRAEKSIIFDIVRNVLSRLQ